MTWLWPAGRCFRHAIIWNAHDCVLSTRLLSVEAIHFSFCSLPKERERERERRTHAGFSQDVRPLKIFFFLFPFFFLPCNTLPLANNNSRFGRNVGSFFRCYARLLIPKKMYILYFGVFVIFCWHSGSFLFLDHRLSRGHPYNGSCPNRTVTRCQKMSKSHSTATSR